MARTLRHKSPAHTLLVRVFVSLAAGLLALTCAAAAVHVEQATSTFRDESNRTLLFHGINYVEKGTPYYPTIDDAEISKLKLLRANVVRIGVMLPGLFPTNATPDVAYLKEIESTVDRLWAAGIYSVLDLHQDVLGPQICGEGTPDWMWNVSELNSLPFPEPMAFKNLSTADPSSGSWVPPPVCSSRGPLSFIGWSAFYFTDACGKAFGQMYEGRNTLGKMVEMYWTTVATHFKGKPGVLAYEMLNEPWLGDHVGHPSLLLKGGAAEKSAVGPFMERMHASIRAVDADTMVLFSPAELNNRLMRSVGYDRGFLPGEPMAFHVYCVTGTDGAGPTTPLAKGICHFNDGFQLSTRRSDLRRIRTAGLVTEFGAVSDSPTGLAEVRFVAEHFDLTSMPLSWIFWDRVPEATDYRRELGRSFAPAVAGDIKSMTFNASSGDFELAYVARPGTTEIALAEELHYPDGFRVTFEPVGCCSYSQVADTGIAVRVLNATEGPTVRVIVKRT